jgi:hypothetical protein
MSDSSSEAVPSTPVAVLGTLAEFHREPIPYNLTALVQLATSLRPDLLCLDMTIDQWRQRAFEDLPPEYRDGLLPLADQTDIVVVPVAGDRPPKTVVSSGWQKPIIALLRRWLATLQRSAPGPDAVNSGPRHFIADVLYTVSDALAGRRTWQAHRAHADLLVRHVLKTARRDPQCRVLVVVNVRYCHQIRQALRTYPEVQVVHYTDL